MMDQHIQSSRVHGLDLIPQAQPPQGYPEKHALGLLSKTTPKGKVLIRDTCVTPSGWFVDGSIAPPSPTFCKQIAFPFNLQRLDCLLRGLELFSILQGAPFLGKLFPFARLARSAALLPQHENHTAAHGLSSRVSVNAARPILKDPSSFKATLTHWVFDCTGPSQPTVRFGDCNQTAQFDRIETQLQAIIKNSKKNTPKLLKLQRVPLGIKQPETAGSQPIATIKSQPQRLGT